MNAGALITAGVLVGGLVAFKQGKKNLSQQMMRARIVAQGATVALMVGSSGRFNFLHIFNFSLLSDIGAVTISLPSRTHCSPPHH